MILKYKLYYINTILFLFFIFPTIFTLSDECINRGGVCQEKSSCVGNYIPIPGHCEGEESIQCCIENHHTPSENIIDIIKNFEGLRTKAYKCVAGVWTIGYVDGDSCNYYIYDPDTIINDDYFYDNDDEILDDNETTDYMWDDDQLYNEQDQENNKKSPWLWIGIGIGIFVILILIIIILCCCIH
ncbi:hypothetical protein LY90DRAFT_642362 [Neocallimastix californiae]|uniref:Transmembrane protein n=1 Tax=Neocallimastix californiae TaxID=1754190 RepID=A0A1Y2DUI9_9FUNG|nr:hypothetical protein LY90DRAFT_642362 [Neocallimastix californiae]|eukprot:ORY62806.1 hypothetical protein LY90DRAFT_642362 [Neocallimastix californiae]